MPKKGSKFSRARKNDIPLPMPGGYVLSPKEVAGHFRVDVETIRLWLRTGALDGQKLGLRDWIIDYPFRLRGKIHTFESLKKAGRLQPK